MILDRLSICLCANLDKVQIVVLTIVVHLHRVFWLSYCYHWMYFSIDHVTAEFSSDPNNVV